MAEKRKELEKSLEETTDLDVTTPDEDILRVVKKAVGYAATERKDLKEIQDKSKRYWAGNQLKKGGLRKRQTHAKDNRIFISTETIVPLVTTETPIPVVVTLGERDEKTEKKLTRALQAKYELHEIEGISVAKVFEVVVRHLILLRLGCVKLIYNAEIDDFETQWVLPWDVILDPDAPIGASSRFNGEDYKKSLKQLIDLYPDKEGEIRRMFGARSEEEPWEYTQKSCVEFWNDGYVFNVLDNRLVLDKKKNPHFNYDKGADNHFKKPHMPYLFLNAFNLGEKIYDSTSLVEQAIPQQDLLNKTERIITDDLADRGCIVGSGDYIKKEVLEGYHGDTGDKIWIQEGLPKEAFYRFEPKSVPLFAQNRSNAIKAEIDNLMGTHSTTRGEGGARGTFSLAQLFKEGDTGRVGLITRGVERLAADVYNYWVQMMKVYYTKEHELPYSKGDTSEVLKIKSSDLNGKVRVHVKANSMLPSEIQGAKVELTERWARDGIDPLSYYEDLDDPRPKEKASRLVLYQNDPVEYAKKYLGLKVTPPEETPPPVAAAPPVAPQMAPPAMPPPVLPPEGVAPPMMPPVAPPPVEAPGLLAGMAGEAPPAMPVPPPAPDPIDIITRLSQGEELMPEPGITEEVVNAVIAFLDTPEAQALPPEVIDNFQRWITMALEITGELLPEGE